MKYINKNTGESISQETYLQLEEFGKSNYILDKSSNTTVNHQIIETKSDNLSVGDGIAVAVLAPIAIVASIFDF